MKCDACGASDANVHLSHVVNEVARRINLCEECAAKHGIHLHGSMSLTEILLGLDSLEGDKGLSAKRCSHCGMQLSDLKKTARMGCASCYDIFAAELKSTIAGMQKGTQHVGKVPRVQSDRISGDSRIERLADELEAAVAVEDYETAARVRDEIRGRKSVGTDRGDEGEGASGVRRGAGSGDN